MKEQFPGQYAIAFLGFATGLRPSSLRPLRRTGPTPDVLWDQGVILVRRSHTLGTELISAFICASVLAWAAITDGPCRR
jgi:hypothetical protein